MISAKRGEQELARNSSFFKLYLSNSRVEETPEDAKEQEAVESEAEAEVGQARSRGSHGKRLDCGRARETWTWAAIKGGRTSYRGWEGSAGSGKELGESYDSWAEKPIM